MVTVQDCSSSRFLIGSSKVKSSGLDLNHLMKEKCTPCSIIERRSHCHRNYREEAALLTFPCFSSIRISKIPSFLLFIHLACLGFLCIFSPTFSATFCQETSAAPEKPSKFHLFPRNSFALWFLISLLGGF